MKEIIMLDDINKEVIIPQNTPENPVNMEIPDCENKNEPMVSNVFQEHEYGTIASVELSSGKKIIGHLSKDKKQIIKVGNYLRVLERVSNKTNPDKSGLKVEFENGANQLVTTVLKTTKNYQVMELLRNQFYICDTDEEKQINSFIINNTNVNYIQEDSKPGWKDGNVFLTPLTTETAKGYRLEGVEPVTRYNSNMVDGWINRIYPHIKNSEIYMFMVYAGLSAVLMPITTGVGYGIHLRGNSGLGKTLLARLLNSLFNDNKLNKFKTWHTTGNGLLAYAELHNHHPLILDEFGNATQDALSTIYSLFNGVGKMRANQTGGFAGAGTWETVLLSVGEKSIADTCDTLKVDQSCGEIIRFINIETNIEKDRLDNDSIKAIYDIADDYCGVGIPLVKYIQSLQREVIKEDYNNMFESLRIGLPTLTHQAERVLRYFANIALAGIYFHNSIDVANQLNIKDVVKNVFKRMLEENYFDRADPATVERQKLAEMIGNFLPVEDYQKRDTALARLMSSNNTRAGVILKEDYIIYPEQAKKCGFTLSRIAKMGFNIGKAESYKGVRCCVIPKSVVEEILESVPEKNVENVERTPKPLGE